MIPTQHCPANLLRLRPTGQAASMLLYPQDDFRTWCRMYPPETVYQQFAKMAALWKEGVAVFEKALRKVASAKKSVADHDLAIMRTCYTHFQSTANQVEFYLLRAKLDHGPERQVAIDRMRIIVQQEIELAKLQFQVTRTHSTIAYEASNHYYYTPLGLVEKILNCRQILDEMGSNQ